MKLIFQLSLFFFSPKLTSTLKKNFQKPCEAAANITEGKPIDFNTKVYYKQLKKINPLRKPNRSDPVRSALLPHLDRASNRERGREKREEREKEVKKRRRRADKIMKIVADRAATARTKQDFEFENTTKKSTAYFANDVFAHQITSAGPRNFRKTTQDINNDRSPDRLRLSGTFVFCLCWANRVWSKK